MLTYQVLKMNAIDDLKGRIENFSQGRIEDEIYTIIHEIVENWIPVHNRDILEIALSNMFLVCEKSELGPAYGQDYPINRIISNIYDFLSEDLSDWYYTKYE